MENIVASKPTVRWVVTVSVAGQVVGQHECPSRQRAGELLTEVRELAEDLAYLLPGLCAAGYELQSYEQTCEPEAADVSL